MKKKTVRDNGKILSGICFALIIGFWCIATYGGLISDLFLPSPTEVVKKIIEMAKDGSLWANCWESTARVLVGWIWSVIVALPVGMRYGIRCRPKHDKCGKNVGCRQMANFWMEKGECETDDLTDFFELVK